MKSRHATPGFLALGIFLSLCGIASAATHTISWSPVDKYTDGTAISGKTITYSLYWSTSPQLTTLTMFDYGLTRTTRTFDPATLGMAVGATVYFTMKTTLSNGEASSYAPPRAWVVPATSTPSSGISAGGSSADDTGASGGNTVTSPQSGGSTSPNLSVNAVEIVLRGPASPGDLRIGRRSSSPFSGTWRLSWRAVTEFANGQELGAGQAVRYNAYWTRDPSLAPGNLVPIAASTSSVFVDFQPQAKGMANNEMVYFTLQAVLDSGDSSALSGSLPWRVSSRGPAAPARGKIGIRGSLLKK